MNLAQSNVINLDSSIRGLLEPVASVMKEDPGSLASLHILCCNEYALVTGLADPGSLGDISRSAESIRKDFA
jgi:hypothetical protein